MPEIVRGRGKHDMIQTKKERRHSFYETMDPKTPCRSAELWYAAAGGKPPQSIGGAVAAVIVGGAAVWGGYEIATRVILHNILPEGAEIPANRGQLALLVWNTAGRPEPVNTPAFADVADADTAKAARIQTTGVKKTEEVHGKGMRVFTDDGEILAGRSSWLLSLSPEIRGAVDEVERSIEGMTGVHVMRGGRYLGAVGLEDKLRYNAKVVGD